MTTMPRRRWLLFAVAVAVVVVGIGLAVFWEAPQGDVPRLVILRRDHTNGQNVVVYHVSKHQQSPAVPRHPAPAVI